VVQAGKPKGYGGNASYRRTIGFFAIRLFAAVGHRGGLKVSRLRRRAPLRKRRLCIALQQSWSRHLRETLEALTIERRTGKYVDMQTKTHPNSAHVTSSFGWRFAEQTPVPIARIGSARHPRRPQD